MTLVTTPAVLLRSFPYSETSRILRFYTEELGTVGVVARGVRSQGSRGRGALETFAGGTLTLHVKATRELQTFREFTPANSRSALAGDVLRFAAASVVAELVLRHGGEAGNPELFAALESALDELAGSGPGTTLPTLLAQGWRLVSTLGYRPSLDGCIRCGTPFDSDELGRFDFEAGGVRCARCQREGGGGEGPRLGPGARAQLEVLTGGRGPPDLRRLRAHLQLLSDFVAVHVAGGHPLKAFGVLWGLLPPEGGREGGEDPPDVRGDALVSSPAGDGAGEAP